MDGFLDFWKTNCDLRGLVTVPKFGGCEKSEFEYREEEEWMQFGCAWSKGLVVYACCELDGL